MTALARILCIALCAAAAPAAAFEPYTHNFTGDQARLDAIDGFVTIEGREYPVRAEVVQALRDWPSYYDSGVIGPDIYPDLLYGWNLIHTSDGTDDCDCETKPPDLPVFSDRSGESPAFCVETYNEGEQIADESEPGSCVQSGDTGQWLELVLRKAWAAQTDPRYSAAERAQILAFSYGFITHAAGDLWAHTLVNDFATDLWPALGEVLTDADALKVALRHKGVEAYIGDATPFYDGNPDRTVLPSGDISDSSTPHRRFDAPHRFLFETFVDPFAETPTTDAHEAHPEVGPTRELTLGFFLDLRREVGRVRASLPPRPVIGALLELIEEHDRFNQVFAAAADACGAGDGEGGFIRTVRECLDALASIDPDDFDARDGFLSFRSTKLNDSADGILARYLDNWIEHIDTGLAHWGELSLALNRAYFDPDVRRDLQNRECDPACPGPECDVLEGLRADCEDGIGSAAVIIDETNEFVNEYMLAMLGAPPIVGDVRRVRQQFEQKFDEAVGRLVSPVRLAVNPLIVPVQRVIDDARERIFEHLTERFGVDVDDLQAFSNGAAHWLDLETVTITTPQLGTQSFSPLYQPGDHEHLDGLLGLEGPGHHVPRDPPSPNAGGLADDATLDPERFAPLANTIALAKLLLLDPPALDRLLGDILAEQGVVRDPNAVRTYQELEAAAAPANVMVEALTGTPWLRSITSDHSWRVDSVGELFPEFEHVRGGTGQFPLWESCLLRPAFRVLFADWENPGPLAPFPDLGDVPSPDPSVPDGPAVERAIEGRQHDDGERYFVDRDAVLTLTTSESAAFAPEHLALRWRATHEDGVPGEFVVVAGPEATFTIEGPDGDYLLEYQSQDPCHTFANEGAPGGEDPLPPGEMQTARFTIARVGTESRDRLRGTPADEIFVGLAGNDQISAGGGNDELIGGPGDDRLDGGDHDDLLSGGEGDDTLIGGRGNDELHGGAGRDRLRGDRGNDVLSGDENDDVLRGSNDADSLAGGPGRDRLNGGAGVDVCESGGDRLKSCEGVE